MESELLERLDLLAATLGTTVEMLWTTLISIGFRLGVVSAVILVLFIPITYLCYTFISKALTLSDETARGDSENPIILCTIKALFFGILALIMFIFGLDNINYLLIPESYAFNILGGLI